MPPTVPTPTLAASGCPGMILQSTSGPIQMVGPQAGPTSVFASHHYQPVQLMSTCLQGPGSMQMVEGWTTLVPIATAPPNGHSLMVHTMPMLQQGHLPGPAAVQMSQPPVISCSQPVNSMFNPLTNSTNMEVVWHGIFDQLFCNYYPDQWTLIPVCTVPNEPHYKKFQDSAKVRFLCQGCGKAWTSMKGRVIFMYHLDHVNKRGIVFFKLFGQKCLKCTGNFEHAMWYPEEVNKVVLNIFNAVGRAFYGLVEAPVLRDRRKGKPRTQHNASLCQACADNICLEGNNNCDRSMMILPGQ